MILQIRPAKSAEAYKQVWTDNGSPLLDISKKQLDKIQSSFKVSNPKASSTCGCGTSFSI